MERLTMKTSTVIVSIGGNTSYYRSISDVPAALRKKVNEATAGANSATIIIADEAGRREIAKSAGGRGQVGSALGKPFHQRGTGKSVASRVRQWLELALLAGIGACLFLLARWQ